VAANLTGALPLVPPSDVLVAHRKTGWPNIAESCSLRRGCGLQDAAMAKPLIPADAILAHALEILDAEGAEALNLRRLSSDLKISPRTSKSGTERR
jgi:hypothetical protein